MYEMQDAVTLSNVPHTLVVSILLDNAFALNMKNDIKLGIDGISLRKRQRRTTICPVWCVSLGQQGVHPVDQNLCMAVRRIL